ncbi:putative riboflavin biosynthesis protein Rib7 [Pseudomassariella vexata]|uniref:2,5-diamino-6-ribosylamino-4(3H)-pyrimidinone 5'-phosphate reductase n=1 Tax=Pseudomassariella vexata TaxID=1141098 RepID=A0A1Y2DV75_9PEZI|nr:putative riboflavin biosynthesis protein Rib7 [Pseudomassariella vexata]ORY63173.1 putative riboflavin biosynthesis protein Rib7 [Pseudomassariella vexata]
MSEQTLTFPDHVANKLEPHLPRLGPDRVEMPAATSLLPFVTLTFATSLDSGLSLAPGTRTTLSGSPSKAMTHYLRSRHDAICIGVGTAVADDPGLNCRLDGAASQPRPIVIDPALRWNFSTESTVMRLARAGRGLAPFIITANCEPHASQKALLEGLGGKYLVLPPATLAKQRFQWDDILQVIAAQGLRSIMVEGGGEVINSLLEPQNAGHVGSVIVTIAPTWLGQGSVCVCPARRMGPDGQPVAAARLTEPHWIPLGEDVVLCGKLAK